MAVLRGGPPVSPLYPLLKYLCCCPKLCYDPVAAIFEYFEPLPSESSMASYYDPFPTPCTYITRPFSLSCPLPKPGTAADRGSWDPWKGVSEVEMVVEGNPFPPPLYP